MGYKGTAFGSRIELDKPLPFADGTRVRVNVAAEEGSRKGSPAALLRLAGTLTCAEADAILEAAQGCRRIDESLWSDGR